MSEYVIRGDEGFQNTPFIVCEDSSDLNNYIPLVVEADYTGTVSDPKKFYSANTGYLSGYASGGDNMFYKRMDSATTGLQTGANYYVIFAYSLKLIDEYSHRVLFIPSSTSDYSSALQTVINGSWTTSNVLYIATSDSELPSFVVDIEDEWEQPIDPSFDPSISQGGENADLDQIYSEDIDPFFDLLPSDPEALLSHDHIRMMQPYLLSASQWLQLGYLFWQDADQSTSFFERLKELMSKGTQNPMDAIAGLIRLPLTSSAVSHSGTASDIYLGSLKVEGTGGASATGYWINSRWAKLGYVIDIKEVFGTDYDYTKTKMHIYLPYVGQQELNVAEVMNGKLYANYIIDVYTGDLVCNLALYKDMYGKSVKSSIARYKGNCALPMFYSRGDTQGNTQNIYNGLLSFGGAVASNNLQGGLSAMGNMAFGERTHVQKSGSVSGASGWCDVQYPYLIIERQVPLYANEWRKINGAVQWATFTVSALTGYTKFHEIHVHIPGASDDEKNEIESILKSGIIL